MSKTKKPKPRVAVLGAGFPALVVANALKANYDVEVFGRPEAAGVLSGMGPRHLWVAQGLNEATYPTVSYCPQVAAGVAFMEKDGTVGVLKIDEKASTHLPHWAGYWTKVNGVPKGSPPCQGKSHYMFYARGFEALALDLSAVAGTLIVAPEVGSIYEDHGTYTVTTITGKWEGYEAVVTTLRPDVFANLAVMRGGPLYYGPPPYPREMYFGWSKQPPTRAMRLLDPTRADSQMLVYSGRLEDPWHRCSSTPKGWCYEFATSPSDAWRTALGVDAIVKAPTRIAGELTPFHYCGKIVPVGRYAEWDQELMVSDVICNLTRYVKEVFHAVQS